MDNNEIYVVLLAAGKSTRLGGDIAKPWCELGGKTVLEHSLEFFGNSKYIKSGVIVVSEDALGQATEIADKFGWTAVIGGQERAFSVKAGLNSIASNNPEYVLIHDAARPFISEAVIHKLIEALNDGAEAVIPALKSTDTLKAVENNIISGSVKRDKIWRVQTPQAFKFSKIKSCHDNDLEGLDTDDGTLIEKNGGEVKVIHGDILMDKITTKEDLERARLIALGLQSRRDKKLPSTETRMALGFDVHKFSSEPGPLVIGGISIPHEFCFAAHSDGDVALHAITDAIYGLIADGDIGSHFPPSDNQWKDKDSSVFLLEAQRSLLSENGKISFIDLTIIAEEPKIGPHRDKMRKRIADLLELDISRVSVKATTSEGLGFTGRKEGIAAQAAITAQFT